MLKALLKVSVGVVALYLVTILVFGIWLWYSVATRELNMASYELTDADVVSLKAFLDRHAQGGSQDAPSKQVDDLQLRLLTYDAGQFRDGAARASTVEKVAELPQVFPGAFRDLLLGEITTQFPLIWPYMLAGSFMVTGNTLGDEPIVAFYNPYFDVALLTKWSFKDHNQTEGDIGFRLTEVVPTTGRAFIENRPSLATDQPVWTGYKAIFEVRIVEAAQHFAAAFEERYPPLERTSAVQLVGADTAAKHAAISVAETRVFTLLRWVIDAQDPNAPVNYADAIKTMQHALSADSPTELNALLPSDNPQSAEMFFQLDRDIREGMKPYLVVDKNVIFIDPVNLRTAFISAYFEKVEAQAGGYVPKLVLLFRMDATNGGE